MQFNDLWFILVGGMLLGACNDELRVEPQGGSSLGGSSLGGGSLGGSSLGGSSQGGSSQGGSSQGGSNSWTISYDQVRTNLDVPAAARLLTRADFNGDGLVDLIAGGDRVCFRR